MPAANNDRSGTRLLYVHKTPIESKLTLSGPRPLQDTLLKLFKF